MAGFRIGNTIKTYEIENEDGSIFKTYSFDIGNESDYLAITSAFEEIQKLGDKFDSKIIEKQKRIAKGIIDKLLDNDFDALYKRVNKNFNWIILLLEDLIKFYMKESPKSKDFARYK